MHVRNLIEIRNLWLQFRVQGGEVTPVRGISFDIPRATTVALVGESGSGKSVTAQAIMGILPDVACIQSGQILFHHPENTTLDIATLNPNSTQMRDVRGGKISIIFQEPMVSLSPLHTIADQVSEALFLHRDVSRKEALGLTQQMLTLVGFPRPKQAMKQYPFELSGGLRQRAMIAMALVCHPTLLIADEPTTALDVTTQAQIIHLIQELQSELQMSVLLITHDLGVVANMADYVVVMYHGEIVESGPKKELFRNAKHPYLTTLMGAVPHFDMKPGERLLSIRETPVSIEDEFWPKKTVKGASKQPHLATYALEKRFSVHKAGLLSIDTATIKAVDGVSLEVRRGECFGLVGESGCGKTTFSKMLMGAMIPDRGTITYWEDDDHALDIPSLDGKRLLDFRRKMQFIFQDPFSSLSPRMTIFDILREPFVIHKIGDKQSQREATQKLMELVGLDAKYLNRYPHCFSGGQRQRIGIARALALHPQLLICDEPVSALDVSIQAQVLNLLKDLQSMLGLTYLFISHNLAVVDYIADRIGVMCHGRLVELAPREILFRNPVHPYTQTLLKAVPFADLDHPLDLNAVMNSRVSDPEKWPGPFAIHKDSPGTIAQIDDEHWIHCSDIDTVKSSYG